MIGNNEIIRFDNLLYLCCMIENIKTEVTENQQGCILSTGQCQVLLTGYFGDGHITKTERQNRSFVSSSIVKENLIVKKLLLGDLVKSPIKSYDNSKGYGKNSIYRLQSISSPLITEFDKIPLEEKFNMMTELGLALMIYDDGSLHKKNHFYNICTHSHSYEFQRDVIIPKLNTFGIFPKLQIERKKDGREFWYLRVGRHDGAFEISKILSKYPVEGMEYKMWSSETILNWSKLQVELKSEKRVLTNRAFGNEIKKRLSMI